MKISGSVVSVVIGLSSSYGESLRCVTIKVQPRLQNVDVGRPDDAKNHEPTIYTAVRRV